MKRFLPLAIVIALYVVFGCNYLRADSPCGNMGVNAAPHTSNGFVKQGCHGLAFLCGTGATCSAAGATIPAGVLITIPIPSCATANDVQYTVSGGTLWSIEVR